MNKNISISISGVNLDIKSILESNYKKNPKKNLQITNIDNNTINLQFLEYSSTDFVLSKIEEFINSLEDNKVYKLNSSYVFDEGNSLIKGPMGKKELTSKEVMFLKMLILTNKIVTYSQMIKVLWRNQKEVSPNAVRLFVKNIKKKLPMNMIKNFQDTGYKLIL